MRRIWKIIVSSMILLVIICNMTVYGTYTGNNKAQTWTGVTEGYGYMSKKTAANDIIKTYIELYESNARGLRNTAAESDLLKIQGAFANGPITQDEVFQLDVEDMLKGSPYYLERSLSEEQIQYLYNDSGNLMSMQEIWDATGAEQRANASLTEGSEAGGETEAGAGHEIDMEEQVEEEAMYQGGAVIQDFVDGSQYSESGASVAMIDPTTDQGHYNPNGLEGQDTTKVSTIINNILGAIQVLGSIIAVGALMIIGIRYMAGSIEEKAMYKQTLGPYVVGAILLFAIVNIVSVAYDVFSSIN